MLAFFHLPSSSFILCKNARFVLISSVASGQTTNSTVLSVQGAADKGSKRSAHCVSAATADIYVWAQYILSYRATPLGS